MTPFHCTMNALRKPANVALTTTKLEPKAGGFSTVPKRKISEAKLAKLAAQAAAILGQDVEQIKQAVTEHYIQRDQIIEANSVVLYYEYRREIHQRKQKGNEPAETDSEFATRLRKWSYKLCKECQGEFSYSYQYDDVGFCSLDCVARNLKKAGITFDYSRPLESRWGYQHHPAIVPAPALRAAEESLAQEFGDTYESPEYSSQPTPRSA